MTTWPLLLIVAAPPDYLREVQPLLRARCGACHGALKQEAGLRLDTGAATRKGGAALPGQPDASPLLQRVSAKDAHERMPPEGAGAKLDARELDLLRRWLAAGAPSPADETPEADPRQHWSFQPPRRPPVPAPRDAAWRANPIDAFAAAEHERHGLKPQPEADRATLLRRVSLDLVGLPPAHAELAAFAADPDPDAYRKAVDRLLASPAYGERWGRHWLDIWRYCEDYGANPMDAAEVSHSQRHLWRWRDWVVDSLNADAPYDAMVRDMLAADELAPTDPRRLAATGYLVRPYHLFNRNAWLDDVVEHTGKAFLGLTFNCAKCHDHKYDPFAQKEYYQWRAFFEPYQVRHDQLPGAPDLKKDGLPRVFDCNLTMPTYRFAKGNEQQPIKAEPLAPRTPAFLGPAPKIVPVALPAEAHAPGLRAFVAAELQAAAAAQWSKAQDEFAAATAAYAKDRNPKTKALATAAERALAASLAERTALHARSAADQTRATNAPEFPAQALAAASLERAANALRAGAEVARAEAALAAADPAQKKKLEDALAKARRQHENMLAAAAKTDAAYTPIAGSRKARQEVTEPKESWTAPYPQTSTGRRAALANWLTRSDQPLFARVAVNHLWTRHFGQPLVATVNDFGRHGALPTHPELLDWLATEFAAGGFRMKPLHRLMVTSKAYRLSSSARGADAKTVAADPDNRWLWRKPAQRLEGEAVRDALLHLAGTLDPQRGGPPVEDRSANRRRSLYFRHAEGPRQRFLMQYDPPSVQECYRRTESVVPQQALALANSKLAADAAAAIAGRLSKELPPGAGDDAFVAKAFLHVLATAPSPAELAECRAALAAFGGKADPARARRLLALALLNHNDFVEVR